MQESSEFISFISEKSRVKNLNLIGKDVLLHRILREIHSSELGENYLFKGGSCLIKCYFGYYRFSVDLDFTWRDQSVWAGLGKSKLRKSLLARIREFASLLERVSEDTGLRFEAKLEDKNFIEFGGGGRMATFKLWKGTELIKVQVVFVEKMLFKPKVATVKTLLDDVKLTREEKAYFEEFLQFYRPFQVDAYDEREILCEKVRAILTRKAQKLRDFYDLFMLHQHGFKVENFRRQIAEKVRAALYYKKYREALKRNVERLEVGREITEDPFERNLFIIKPTDEFDKFLRRITKTLREIATSIHEEKES